MGQMASMLWWPDGFCERLAAAGRRVIRYDHRDTGESTSYEPGSPGYDGDDLVDDAFTVLDEHGVERAHLVGMSMGGMLAQLAALRRPERVATLTVMSSTPLGVDTSELAGPAAEYLEHASAYGDLDWSDQGAVADFLVADAKALGGTKGFDEAEAREFVERDLARTANTASLPNHTLLEGGDVPEGGITTLSVPLLVVHGSADPLFPPEHGRALAAAVPGAELVLLEGGGHEVHPAHWDELAAAITRHTA